jgi:hypothetical protein
MLVSFILDPLEVNFEQLLQSSIQFLSEQVCFDKQLVMNVHSIDRAQDILHACRECSPA